MTIRFDISNPVSKPWGFEFEYFDNGRFSIWVLLLGLAHKSGYLERPSATSMHLHENKDAIAFCVSGEVDINTEEGSTKLTPGQHIFLEAGYYHQISTCFPNSILIEIESPSDRTDIRRLKDMYGREFDGYVWTRNAYLNAASHGFVATDNGLNYRNKPIITSFKGNPVEVVLPYGGLILTRPDVGLRLSQSIDYKGCIVAEKEGHLEGFILHSFD